MERSPLFVAFVALLSAVLLFIFGLAAVRPEPDGASTKNPGLVTPLTAPTVDFGNPLIGSLDAPIRIVEFGDYECEGCAEFNETLLEVLPDYGSDVLYVWKDAPDSASHPNAINAAVAARCAGEQGAYWDYHGILFAQQGSITEASFAPLATEIGVDVDMFKECYDAQRTLPLVRRDHEEAVRLGIDATPYIFINSQRVSGPLSPEQLRGYLDGELLRKFMEIERAPQ
jgi:protein-disulfide isomerase